MPRPQRLGRPRRRRRDLPARRRAAARGDGDVRRPHCRGRRRARRAPSCSGTPTSRSCAASAGRCRSWSPAARGRSPGPAGLCAQARPATGRPRDRAARPGRPGRQRAAGRGGSRCGPAEGSLTTTSRSTSSSRTSATPASLARGRRRGRRRRAPAEVPHWRAGGRAFPAADALAALDRRRAGPRDAVQVHGRPARRRPAHRRPTASSTTASSTCWSPPGSPSTAPRRTRSSTCWSSATARARRPAATLDLAGARRWFTSFGSCSVAEPLADLRALGLVTSVNAASGSTTCPTASSRSPAARAGSACATTTTRARPVRRDRPARVRRSRR